MWDVLFWVQIVFLVLVAWGTVGYGRQSSDGYIRHWRDVHAFGALLAIAAAWVVRHDYLGDSLLFANVWLLFCSAIAMPWARQLKVYFINDWVRFL